MLPPDRKLLSLSPSEILLTGVVLLIGSILLVDLFILSTHKKPSPNLPVSSTGNTPHAVPTPLVVSLSSLPPLASGSPFTAPVLQPHSSLALYTVFGHVASIVDTSDKKGKWLVIQKTNGSFIEPVEIQRDALVTIAMKEQGKPVTRTADINEIRKGDSVTVSYNIDLKNKAAGITGVDIDRTK